MKNRLILLLLLTFTYCGQSKEDQNKKAIEKLDEMKNCLKYNDQENCEDRLNIQLFKDQGTGQMMYRDLQSGNYVLPYQGQNGQPQFQQFQQYPPPNIINNVVPQQSSNHDFLLGTMMGMTLGRMSNGMTYYEPPSYHRGGNTTINKTTIIKNYDRPYSEKRAQAQRQRQQVRQEREVTKRERQEKARERRQEKKDRLERNSSRNSGINLSKSSDSSSRNRASNRESRKSRDTSSRRSSSRSSSSRRR